MSYRRLTVKLADLLRVPRRPVERRIRRRWERAGRAFAFLKLFQRLPLLTQSGHWLGRTKSINYNRIQLHPTWLDPLFSQHELIHFISTYGYAVVALIIGLECLGLPLPGETILIAAAIYAGSGHELNIWLVICGGAPGAILGNTIGFWIGREGGYRLLLRYGHHLKITESRIKLGQYLFLHHCGKLVFFS